MIKQAHKEFATTACPLNWFEVAKLLHENAQTLYNSPHGHVIYSNGTVSKKRATINRSVFLLSAIALENLIKAYLVYENPSYTEGGRLSKKLLSHKLSSLQEQCKKAPSPKRTQHVFKTLELGVNSWARYPCSTSIEQETLEGTVTPEFWDAYCKVFDLYSRKLEELLRKKWKGAYGEITYVEFHQ